MPVRDEITKIAQEASAYAILARSREDSIRDSFTFKFFVNLDTYFFDLI
jgi:hypothetical protein